MMTTATPRERAQDILKRETLLRLDSIADHKKQLSALTLAIEIFGDDSDVSFDLTYDAAQVYLGVSDINATLNSIHHRMRSAGWNVTSPFNKEYLSWYWREDKGLIDGPMIRFGLHLTDNTTCKRVQVGVEEVPVYEIQCESAIKEPDDDT